MSWNAQFDKNFSSNRFSISTCSNQVLKRQQEYSPGPQWLPKLITIVIIDLIVLIVIVDFIVIMSCHRHDDHHALRWVYQTGLALRKTGRSLWTPSSLTGIFPSNPINWARWFKFHPTSILPSSHSKKWIKVKCRFPKRAFFQTTISTSWPSSAAWCLCQVRSRYLTLSNFTPVSPCQAVHGQPAGDCSRK